MNTTPENTPQSKPTRLEDLKKQMEVNRDKHIRSIFEVYDKIPDLLSAFKEEGVSEEETVNRLAQFIEKILISYELSQIPLMFETIKAKKDDGQIITTPAEHSRIIIP